MRRHAATDVAPGGLSMSEQADRACFRTFSEEETRSLGAELGAELAPGQVVALRGELGSGKTVVVQGAARGLGFVGNVSSPSFVIVNEYVGRFPIYHVDLYRLERASSLEELGHREMFWGDGVALVEWAERAEELLPADRVDVTITITGPGARALEITASGAGSARTVAAVRAAWEKSRVDADPDD